MFPSNHDFLNHDPSNQGFGYSCSNKRKIREDGKGMCYLSGTIHHNENDIKTLGSWEVGNKIQSDTLL